MLSADIYSSKNTRIIFTLELQVYCVTVSTLLKIQNVDLALYEIALQTDGDVNLFIKIDLTGRLKV